MRPRTASRATARGRCPRRSAMSFAALPPGHVRQPPPGPKALQRPRGLADLVGAFAAAAPPLALPTAPSSAGSAAASLVPSLSFIGKAALPPLRFVSASAARQHPSKKAAGYIYADAVTSTQRMLGVCDGISGVQQMGLRPDELPLQMLAQCQLGINELVNRGRVPVNSDGHWLMELIKDAYDRTDALGATTALLVALEENRRLAIANIGDCALLLLRLSPVGDARLVKRFRTDALRYEANKPVQLMRFANTNPADTHLVISGARMNTVACEPGDLIVMGSDGIFDNLEDEEIVAILEEFFLELSAGSRGGLSADDARRLAQSSSNRARGKLADTGLPAVLVLQQAAQALVDAAIANVSTEGVNASGTQEAEVSKQRRLPGSADDTTALVAMVVEASSPAAGSDLLRPPPPTAAAMFAKGEGEGDEDAVGLAEFLMKGTRWRGKITGCGMEGVLGSLGPLAGLGLDFECCASAGEPIEDEFEESSTRCAEDEEEGRSGANGSGSRRPPAGECAVS